MSGPWYRQGSLMYEDAGAATLEFALTSVVLFMSVFGIMGFSLEVFAYHQVAEAAREGTRYAMVRGNKCVIDGTSCTATAEEIQSYVQGLALPGINASSLMVNTSYSAYPTGSSCTPNANCANPGDLVTVQVTYPAPLDLPFVPHITLMTSASSSMVISQ